MIKGITVLVRRDALLEIEKDTFFGQKLARAILISDTHNIQVDVPSRGYANAAVVTREECRQE